MDEGAGIATVSAAFANAHLDAARSWFEKRFPGTSRRVKKPVVYIFDTPESYYVYADFTSEDRLEHTSGVYFGPYQQLLFHRAETEEETLEVMTHECFHEYLRSIAPNAPAWLHEGLAEYVSTVVVRDGSVREEGATVRDRLRVLKIGLKEGWEGIPFEVMMRETKEQFYSIAPTVQYAQAWSMAHFFMRYRDGKYRPLMEAYLQGLVEGKPPHVAQREAFGGIDLADLRAEWLDYVRELR